MTRWQTHGIVLCLYAVLAIGMTWPVVPNITTRVAGSGGDPWQTMWRFETKDRAGWNEFIKDVTGQGEARLINLSVWPWMPLHFAFGQPTAYNIVWLLSFILSGYAVYLLVYTLADPSSNQTKVAAWLAGLAYMFLPYHVAHSFGHFGAMQIQWLPFIIVAAISWWRRPRIIMAIVLVCLFTIQVWSEHHYALWLSLFALVAAIYWRAQIRVMSGQRLRWIFAMILIGLLGGGAAYIPTARLAFQNSSPLELGREQLLRFSADPFAFIIPASFHSVWGNLVDALFNQHFTGNVAESTQYLGIIVLLVSLFFHQLVPVGIKRFWLIVGILFFVISLGPQLHILGNIMPVPLPYGVIDSLPVFSAIRAVSRAGVMVGLAVSVFFGLVLATQLRRKWSAAVITALLLLDFLFIPVPTQSAAIPEVYEKISSLSGRTVLEIPAATNYTIASRALYGSTVHGKEVLGNIALERAHTEDELAEIKQLPGVRQLLYLRTTELRQDRAEFFDQNLAETLPDAMASKDATAIIVHPDSLSILQWMSIKNFLEENLQLTPQPIADTVLYELNGKVATDGVLLTRKAGWEHIGFDAERNSIFAEIPTTATATLLNVTDQDKVVDLLFTIAPESLSSVAVVIDGKLSEGPIILPPGQLDIQFVASGEGKAIIMNPRLNVKNIK
ncbi:MAG: hypothetical protein HYR90_03155 [Candidatus Andersenbacteria bacterium]|nr:hypothetical protein [Candidatus Andersenbacteria bacterium]MBI3250261.1 hypothetical protein [Candidatus Andersenbacteria bacterium]